MTLAVTLGATTSLFGAAVGFAAAGWALRRRGTRDLLGAITASMLAKMVLLGVGLVVTVRAGAPVIPFVIAFFAVYAVSITAEVVWVTRSLRNARRA